MGSTIQSVRGSHKMAASVCIVPSGAMECDDPYLNGGVEVVQWLAEGQFHGNGRVPCSAFSYGKIAYEVTEYPMSTPSRTIDSESTAAYAHLRNDLTRARVSGNGGRIKRDR